MKKIAPPVSGTSPERGDIIMVKSWRCWEPRRLTLSKGPRPCRLCFLSSFAAPLRLSESFWIPPFGGGLLSPSLLRGCLGAEWEMCLRRTLFTEILALMT